MKNIKSLENKGISKEIIDVWGRSGYEMLLPIQEEAVNSGIFEGKSLLVVSPTSSGKTFIGEMVAVSHALKGKKSLYLVPFKAIAEEKYLEFSEKYVAGDTNLILRISDRDHRENDEDICIGNYDLAIITYEKLSSLLVANPGILDNCECIIVDEVQMMMDIERGGNLELLLTKIKSASKRPQILALSAVLEELNDFDKWLGVEVIQEMTRPVELRQGILKSDGVFQYQEWNTKKQGQEFLVSGSINNLVEFLLKQDEQLIVIKNSVKGSEELALDLAKNLQFLPASLKAIKDLDEEVDTETKSSLLTTLRHSIAFHNADCEIEERRIVESGFRDGEIKVIISTTTLSTGVNLPCKTVVLADNKKWSMVKSSPQMVNWAIGEVRNIFGRAGRLGKNELFGRGIMIANDNRDYAFIKGAYLDGKPESFTSTFEHKDIVLRILDIIATGFGGTEQNISKFLFQTFAAQNWKTPQAKSQIYEYIQSGIQESLENGLIERDSFGHLSATSLGRICVAKQVSIKTFIALSDFINKTSSIKDFDLFFICASQEEVHPSTQFYRGLKREINTKVSEYLANQIKALNSENQISDELLNNLNDLSLTKRSRFTAPALIASLLIQIVQTNKSNKEIRENYGLSASDIRKISQNSSWILDTFSSIASALNSDSANHIKDLADCVHSQSPLACKFLNRIPARLGREEKIRLVEHGYLSEDAFLDKKGSDFRGIINPNKANKIIEEICKKRERNILFWARDHKRRLDAISMTTQLIEDVYSKTGLDLERSICDLLNTNFADCYATRLHDQRHGEPDLLLNFAKGDIFSAQISAKQKNTDFIDSKKAGDVIPQSARLHPNGYICIGRPDFQELAIDMAFHQAQDHNFKLLPVYVLVELYVQVQEKLINKNDVSRFLCTARGYLTVSKISEFLKS